MQNVTNDFRGAITAETRTLSVRGRLQTPDGSIYELNPADIVAGSLSVTSSVFDAGVEIGNVIAADCELSLHNDQETWSGVDLAGAALWLWSGVVLPDETTEEVLLGTFVVEKPSRPNRVISIQAADRIVLLDTPFSDIKVTFPVSAYNLLDTVCNACGVPLTDSWSGAFNMAYMITARPTDDLSCRDVVGLIAAISAANVRMTREGYLDRVPLKPIEDIDWGFGTGDRFSFEQLADGLMLTGVEYTDAAGAKYSAGNVGYVLALDVNPLIQDGAAALISSIWDEIGAFSYVPYTADYPGNPAIDVGDTVSHTTRDGQTLISLVGKHVFAVGQRSTISVPFVPATEKDYLSGNTKRLSTIAVKAEQTRLDLSNYASKSAQISDLMTAGIGLFKTEQEQPDGSYVVIYHNKATLAASDTQWKMTAGAFAVSHDYGATWAAGITADGEMLVTILTAIGIKADWIRVGGSGSDGTIEIKDANDHVIATLGIDGIKLFDTSGNQIGGNALIGDLQIFASGALTDDPTNPNFWAKIGKLVQGYYTYNGIFGYNRDFSSVNPSFALTSHALGYVSIRLNKGKTFDVSDSLTDGGRYYYIQGAKHSNADVGILNLGTEGLGSNAGLSLNYDSTRGVYARLSAAGLSFSIDSLGFHFSTALSGNKYPILAYENVSTKLDFNTLPVGTFFSCPYSAGDTGYHLPSNSGPTWWNVITMGISIRTTQYAFQGFNGQSVPGGALYVRTKHDATWSSWELVNPKYVNTTGDNPNSGYVFRNDGMLEMWGSFVTIVPVAADYDIGLVFPAVSSSFIRQPTFLGSCHPSDTWSGVAFKGSALSSLNWNMGFIHVANTAQQQAFRGSYHVIGPWK